MFPLFKISFHTDKALRYASTKNIGASNDYFYFLANAKGEQMLTAEIE
jgi:hypothetical protein